MFSLAALQSEYSLWERNLDAEIIPLLRELGIGLVPFAPLGRGFLIGTVKRSEEYPEDDFRRSDPRSQGENFDANVRAAETGSDIVPIPGTKRVTYLEEDIAAASIALDAAQIQALDAALAPGNVAGPRSNRATMSTIDRSTTEASQWQHV